MAAGWDDFRFVKAVADRGGLTGAAAALGIDHSTAFRRLDSVERAYGARLFERRRTGYVPTGAGQAMVDTASQMERDVAAFSREVAGRSDEIAGDLRVTAPANFAERLLMPILAEFARRHPAVRIDLILAEEALNLSRRDADVAIRASRGPDETLIGRRLTAIEWAVYGQAGAAYGDLAAERWVGLSETLAAGVFHRFLRSRVAPERVALCLNTVTGLREAIAAGIGIGPLSCIDGDGDPLLRRLGEPEPGLRTDLWLLTHPELRRAARVRAFMDHVAAAMLPLRPQFEGRRGQTSIETISTS